MKQNTGQKTYTFFYESLIWGFELATEQMKACVGDACTAGRSHILSPFLAENKKIFWCSFYFSKYILHLSFIVNDIGC